ncbi:MAG: restriction endonuclease [candidate division Zixibacteria bacterium RBG_16_50_21]|nr:MAG: restriction endonuclease [candidate division Zixibacteria bacterium RBG_16_50_21]
MAIPDYQSIMLPLLKYVGDEKEHYIREAIEALAKQFGLTPEERKKILPSGQQYTFDNRVGWARTYMKKAALIETTRRGYLKIRARGLQVLKENPKDINVRYLRKFPEFVEFQALKRGKEELEKEEESAAKDLLTPEESIETAYQGLRQNLAAELIQQVKSCSPTFFEKLVIDLLISMGYGGTRKDAGEAIGRSGDEGIDGIIKEDRLGLDIVYLQAKRWENPVSRPEIQKFAGALQGQRAKKGIFITTSAFTKDAREYAEKIESKIVLIDGETLAQLMIDHSIGVSQVASYTLKKVDIDYFAEE